MSHARGKSISFGMKGLEGSSEFWAVDKKWSDQREHLSALKLV